MNAVVRRVATPVVVGTALAVAFGAGVAGAYYRSAVRETGTGTATPVAADPFTLTATGAVGTGLFPGGPGADVTVTITNPYTRPITVSTVAAAGVVSATPVAGRTCATHAVAVAAPTSGLPVTVPASSSRTVTLSGAVTMGTTAESGCQGATFSVPFQVSGSL